MYWVALTLGSAVIDAVYFMAIKKHGSRHHYALLAGLSFLTTAILLFIVSAGKGFPQHVGPLFWPGVVGSAIMNVLAVGLYFRMLPKTDLSLAVPMLSFTPVFLLLSSFFLLHEVPSLAGLFGILLIITGSYVLNLHHLDRHVFAPFHALFTNKGTRAMMVVAVIFGFVISVEKLVIIDSDPFFGAMFIELLVGLSFLAIAVLTGKASASRVRKALHYAVPLGLLLGTSIIFFNFAVQQQLASYVLSVKRMSILFSVGLGYFFFKEQHILQRAIGAAFMVAGVAVIVLW